MAHKMNRLANPQIPDGDAHKISMAMTTLQNPVKARLEAITDDLKNVTKAQRNYGKALDRVSTCAPEAADKLQHASRGQVAKAGSLVHAEYTLLTQCS